MEKASKEIQRVLRPFRRRLRLKAALHAALIAAAVCLAVFALFRLGSLIGGWTESKCTVLRTGLLLFSAVGVWGYCILRPTVKSTAKAVDALGLQDRAATMAHYAGDTSSLAGLQRRDAIAHIQTHAPREIPLRFPPKLWAALLAAFFFASLTFVLPKTWFCASIPASVEETEEARLARELLDDLRRRIQEADLTDEERDRLLAQLKAAEAGADANMGLEALAEVMQASGQLEQALDGMERNVPWTETLLEDERLRPIAQALIDGDTLALQTALAVKYREVTSVSGTEQIIALMDLKTAVTDALEAHEPNDSDAYLAYVMSNFANDMEGAAQYVASHTDPSRVIYSAFSRLERQLITIINGGALIVEAEEDEDTVFIQRESSADSGEDTAASGRTAEEGQEQDESMLLYTSDPDSMQGAGMGLRAKQHYQETELIYEPSLDPYSSAYEPARAFRYQNNGVEIQEGHVAYGQVYGIYYAQLLDALADGSVPQDLMKTIETYFYGI